MSAPKPPTPKKVKVNPYAGMTSDPEFAKAAEELGYTNVNKDHEVAAVKEYMFKNTVEDERRDKVFRKAEKQLYKEGILETNDPFTDKQSWKEHYIKQNNLEGDNAQNQANKAYKEQVAKRGKNFIYSDDTDTDWELQKIYDRMYDIESNQATKKANKDIKQQAADYRKAQNKAAKKTNKQNKQMMIKQIKAQNKAQKKANAQSKALMSKQITAQKQAAKLANTNNQKQLRQQQKAQQDMFDQQQALMEEMMNQPVYSAQQAALPQVQYKAKTPQAMPAAPAPPPAMNIQAAPAPQMTNVGSQMSIVRQSSTAKQRSRRRTRGTSSLSI